MSRYWQQVKKTEKRWYLVNRKPRRKMRWLVIENGQAYATYPVKCIECKRVVPSGEHVTKDHYQSFTCEQCSPALTAAAAAHERRNVTRKPKDGWPLEVFFFFDSDAALSKGQHDPAEFLAVAKAAWEEERGGDDDLTNPLVDLEPERVRHIWYRSMPDLSGDYAYLYYPAKQGQRGAFPVTEVIW